MPAFRARLVSFLSNRNPSRWPGRVASSTITGMVVVPRASSRLICSTRLASARREKSPESSGEASEASEPARAREHRRLGRRRSVPGRGGAAATPPEGRANAENDMTE